MCKIKENFIHLFFMREIRKERSLIMSKKLVAFFSASGTTKKAAEMIAEAAKADLFEIEPKIPYTKADLDWMDKKSRSSVEMSDKKYRPEMIEKEMDTSTYDEIILGFPIWWYVAPTIINTFLEAYDFSGKKIVLFATSGGSGFGNTVKELQPSAPDAVITEGRLLNRGTKQEIRPKITPTLIHALCVPPSIFVIGIRRIAITIPAMYPNAVRKIPILPRS